jgi:hypothetical protein
VHPPSGAKRGFAPIQYSAFAMMQKPGDVNQGQQIVAAFGALNDPRQRMRKHYGSLR